MDDETRSQIDGLVGNLFSMVIDGIGRTTYAFLDHDREAARALIARDTELDMLQDEIEELVEAKLVADDPDLRYLLSVVRIVPELERCGDLVELIALRAAHGLVETLSLQARNLVEQMGTIGERMWWEASDAYVTRRPETATVLRRLDDQLDDLHVQLTAVLAEDELATAAAIEMGLIARFFERLGDHAVNVVRRVPAMTRVG
ncbi:MAG: phosphate signaling complex PhoU family protein [Acidimicrobiales bacterium]